MTSGEKTVLYSPLGLAYGTLYSAILLTRPSRVVVVTSPEAVVNLHAALDAARFYHGNFAFETHILKDALGGFEESRRLAHQLSRAAGERNILNLTGGTTVLQDCVRCIGDILRRQSHNANQSPSKTPSRHDFVREVAVIDRRPPLEQTRSPLLVGELVEVPPL